MPLALHMNIFIKKKLFLYSMQPSNSFYIVINIKCKKKIVTAKIFPPGKVASTVPPPPKCAPEKNYFE